MLDQKLQLEGHCYVLLTGDWYHPIVEQRHLILWYPERALTLAERHMYRPYVQSIVTEDAWLIGTYDRTKVRVLDEDGYWSLPQYQTYAASHNNILSFVLGIRSTIPAMTLDGGKFFKTFLDEYKGKIAKALKRAKKRQKLVDC
jgi:hypothetical protein